MFLNSLVVKDRLADKCYYLSLLNADQGKLVKAKQMH
jgi:hypothetical protein